MKKKEFYKDIIEYIEAREALNKAVFSDCFEKFVQHPEFPRWRRYVDMLESGEPNKAGLQLMIKELGKIMLRDVKGVEDETEEDKIKENNNVEDITSDTIKINNIEKLDDILDKWMMDDTIPEEQTIEVPLHVIKEFATNCFKQQRVNTLKSLRYEIEQRINNEEI